MKLIVVLVAGSLVGCASGTDIKAQIAGANIELAREKATRMRLPLVDIKVPTDKGEIHIVVRSPESSSNDYVPAPDDPWARVAERAVGGLVTAGGIYLGGEAAANIVGSATKGVVDALKVQPAPTIVNAPSPEVIQIPAPSVVQIPAPTIVNTPSPEVIQIPAPSVVQIPAPSVVQIPAPEIVYVPQVQ